ncbi:unnamed protein product [Ectocarpus sp. CCAP 1310/34]|nr:unnamed protein product [Ectocarpus sp. CCAP 1310/34]
MKATRCKARLLEPSEDLMNTHTYNEKKVSSKSSKRYT